MIDLAITAGTLALFDLVFDQNGLSLYKAFFNRFTQNAVYNKGKMLRSSFHRIVKVCQAYIQQTKIAWLNFVGHLSPFP